MHFEWDRTKAERNLKSHRASFDEAVTFFYDPLAATFNDPDHSVDERRLITVGHSSHGRLLVVVHVARGESVRIISARLTTARERKRHEPRTSLQPGDMRREYTFDYSKAVRGSIAGRF